MRIAPKLAADKLIVLGLSGRGDKDVFTVQTPWAANCEPHRSALRRAFVRWTARVHPLHYRRRSRCGMSFEILQKACRGGRDIIELGMPFSDPMADGPAIQASSMRALKSGMTVKGTLHMVERFRARDTGHAHRVMAITIRSTPTARSISCAMLPMRASMGSSLSI